jgi:hypothetical protein
VPPNKRLQLTAAGGVCGGLGRPPSGPGWNRRRRPVAAKVVHARPQLSRDPLGGIQEKMSARELLRVGLILLGTFLIVSALGSLVEGISRRPPVMASDGQSASAELSALLVPTAVSVAASVIFGVLPGVLLIARGERWSARVLPQSVALPSAPGSDLLRVGLILLGLLLGVRGLAGLLGAIALQVAGRFLEPPSFAHGISWQLLTSSCVELAAGTALFTWGRQSARNAA